MFSSWDDLHVPMDHSGHLPCQHSADGRRRPQEEGGLLGPGDDDKVGQSSWSQNICQFWVCSLHDCLLDCQDFVTIINNNQQQFIIPKRNIS